MDIRHILVVIDASREEQQPALERATQLLEHYRQASLTLMICDYIPALDGGMLFESHALEKARESLLEHHTTYLENLAAPLRSQGVQVETTAVWGKRLDRHVLREVQARKPDLVLKTTHQRNPLKRLLLSAADWQLIRYCEVPLWLVKHGENPLKQLCASVDPLHSADKPAALDNKLIACGHELGQQLNAQLHLAHCYTPLPRTMVFDASVIADYEGYAKDALRKRMTCLPSTGSSITWACTPKVCCSLLAVSTSWGGPLSIRRPLSITPMRSHSMAWLRSCREIITVIGSCLTSSRIDSWWRISRWLVGSSSSRILGCWANARAICTRWRSPFASRTGSRDREAVCHRRDVVRLHLGGSTLDTRHRHEPHWRPV